jgi:hypothetical protein
MALGWIIRKFVGGSPGTGLFSYLTSRDQNKKRIELENARQEATKNIIAHLPNGAVFREGTPDGWREILMPPVTQSPLFVLPVENPEPAQGRPYEPTELPQQPRALPQGNISNRPERPLRPDYSCSVGYQLSVSYLLTRRYLLTALAGLPTTTCDCRHPLEI